MSRFSLLLIFTLIFTFLLEEAQASSSSRRRRKYNNCQEQVKNLPSLKIDCLEINRQEYIQRYLDNNLDICYEARSSSYENIPNIAQRQKQLNEVITQCFNSNFSNLTEKELEYVSLFQKQKYEEEQKQKEDRAKFLKIMFSIILGFISLFLLYNSINYLLNKRNE